VGENRQGPSRRHLQSDVKDGQLHDQGSSERQPVKLMTEEVDIRLGMENDNSMSTSLTVMARQGWRLVTGDPGKSQRLTVLRPADWMPVQWSAMAQHATTG
jgi:hypothetical protein